MPVRSAPRAEGSVDFGKWLKNQLDRRGMNAASLAALMHVAPSTVGRWLSGEWEPKAKRIGRRKGARPGVGRRARCSRLGTSAQIGRSRVASADVQSDSRVDAAGVADVGGVCCRSKRSETKASTSGTSRGSTARSSLSNLARRILRSVAFMATSMLDSSTVVLF
jgi:hypothetical protein